MVEKPVVNPPVPYVGPLTSGLSPGKFVRVLGVVSPLGKQFSCSLQRGPNSLDDIALRISVEVNAGAIVINCRQFGDWIEEHSFENTFISRGQEFEILIICELTVFKIGINGQHLCEFPHKVPYYHASHVRVEGDVSISQISLENQPSAPSPQGHSSDMSAPPPPYPGFATGQPVPPQPMMPPQPTLPQAPFNSVPQPIVYPNNPSSGEYSYNPLLQHQQQQQPVPVAALNATPRPYQPATFWSRPYGYYRGNRKMTYIGLAIFVVFSIIALTLFLVFFFKGQREFEEAQKRHEEFRNKHFGGNW